MKNAIRPRQGRVRPEDLVLTAELAELYANEHSRVLAIVRRTLRYEDHAQAEDLAQDAWLGFWQYLLRGNEVRRPAGLIATFARRRVYDYYRLARVRREELADPQSPELDRLVAWIGQDIEQEDDQAGERDGYEDEPEAGIVPEIVTEFAAALGLAAAGGRCVR